MDYQKLLDAWVYQQGFDVWAEDHASVLRNLVEWLNRNAAQHSVQSDGATPCDNCGTIGAHDCSEPDNHPAISPRR